ncbi:MAG: hypothetical protein BJ554DRAFT_2532, partial [Olpidium bornovanus]
LRGAPLRQAAAGPELALTSVRGRSEAASASQCAGPEHPGAACHHNRLLVKPVVAAEEPRPACRKTLTRPSRGPLCLFAAPVRAYELRVKNKAELNKQLEELKQELASLRVQKVAGGASSKLAKMCVSRFSCRGLDGEVWYPARRRGRCTGRRRTARAVPMCREEIHDLRLRLSRYSCSNGVRKSIARVNTVISQQTRDQLRLFYKKKKYLPLDLRPKKTRAIRRRLTSHEASRKTLKAQKKSIHFPRRKYALKA